MPNTIFILVIAIAVVALVLRLLRNRRLREKYAILWILVGLVTLVLGLFPSLLEDTAHLLGFAVPSNLLFLLGFLLLLGVSLHLSLEISVLEDETRVLAEEAAISRLAVERLGARIAALEEAAGAGPRGTDPRSPAPRSHDPRTHDPREPVAERPVSGRQDVARERPDR